MPHVTEIATLFLKAGVDIEDLSSAAYQVARDTFSTIASQPGFQGLHYGSELEDTSIIQLFIEWNSIENHKQFMDSPEYGPFLKRLGTILAKPPRLFHFVPKPIPPAIFGMAPVIEIATFFQTEDHFLSNVDKFGTAMSPAEGFLGTAYGPVVEEIEKEEGAGKGKAVMFCVGWKSMDAHMKFRESKTFEKNIHYLMEGVKGSEMVSRPVEIARYDFKA